MRTLPLSRKIWIVPGGLILIMISGLMVAFQGMNYFIFLASAILGLAILTNPRLGLYLMIFMIPLQYLTLLDNGVTLIRLLGIVVFVSWAAQKMIHKGSIRALLSHSIVLPMLTFLGVCALSMLWSDFNIWRTSMMTYLQLGAWVIMLIDLINTKEQMEASLSILLLGTLFGGGLAVSEFLAQTSGWEFGQRGLGGYGDGNFSSASFMFALPFCFYLIKHGRRLEKMIGISGIPILLSGVAFTVSRTGLLSIPLLVLVQLMIYTKWSSRFKFLLLILTLVLVSAPLWPWQNILYRFTGIWTGGGLQDLGGRFGLFATALQQFLANPWIGRGIGHYYLGFQSAVHNSFLEIAVELGLFAVVAMIWLWQSTWKSLSQARNLASQQRNSQMADLFSSFQISFILYFFFSLALSNESSRLLWLLFAFGAICLNVIQKELNKDNDRLSKLRAITSL